jgi:hypothetical protein
MIDYSDAARPGTGYSWLLSELELNVYISGRITTEDPRTLSRNNAVYPPPWREAPLCFTEHSASGDVTISSESPVNRDLRRETART